MNIIWKEIRNKSYFLVFSVRSKMYCYYNHGTHDYLKLSPYKVEIVSLDPKVELYYEMLSDMEIDTIKELATPRVNTTPLTSN